MLLMYIFYFSFCRSRLLVVMELMEGGELFDRISKQKHFTEFQAAIYTKQVSIVTDYFCVVNILCNCFN